MRAQKQRARVGLVNGRGREDTCSIIRPDKGGQGEGGTEVGWEDGAFTTSPLFIMSLLVLAAANQYYHINENISPQ